MPNPPKERPAGRICEYVIAIILLSLLVLPRRLFRELY
jgi:hypothetical protein